MIPFGTRVHVARYAIRVVCAWDTLDDRERYWHAGSVRRDRNRYPLVEDLASHHGSWPGLPVGVHRCPPPWLVKPGAKPRTMIGIPWGTHLDEKGRVVDGVYQDFDVEPLVDHNVAHVRVRRIDWDADGIVVGHVWRQEGYRVSGSGYDYYEAHLIAKRRVPLYEVAVEQDIVGKASEPVTLLTVFEDDLEILPAMRVGGWSQRGGIELIMKS